MNSSRESGGCAGDSRKSSLSFARVEGLRRLAPTWNRARAPLRREHGIERALVDVSGDIALGAPPPGARGWVVEVEGGGKLLLAHCGVTTSGDTEQFFELGGQRFSHILDPRTGWPLASSNSVTVIARDATDADALATAVRVLGVEQGRAWIEARGARLLAPSSKPVPASDPHASEASSPEVDAGSSAARALQAQRANASSACVERACADH